MSSTTPYTESWRTGPLDTKFYVHLYAAAPKPRAILVFVHGAAEHCGRYTEMHSMLAQTHQIAVFAYDLRGFGRTAAAGASYGRSWAEAQADDVEWAIEESRRVCGDGSDADAEEIPIFLMGCSFGGITVLGLFTDEARSDHPALKHVRGVVGSSSTLALTKPPPGPVVWVLTQIAKIQPWMLFPVRNKPQDLSRNKVTGEEYVKDPLIGVPGSLKYVGSMLDQGRIVAGSASNWPKNLPLLMIHGAADTVASPIAAKTFFDAATAENKGWISYPDGAHELHNEPDGIREKSLLDIVDFILRHSSISKGSL